MTCPFCGNSLSYVAEVLAQTATGIQCPKCWNHLSNLRGLASHNGAAISRTKQAIRSDSQDRHQLEQRSH
jgi:hypothetical protein